MSDETKTTTETPKATTEATPRANIIIPNETFEVEEGLPNLPSGGRTGQSKYSPLILQAKALKGVSKFKVPTGGVPAEMFVRNVRLAIKKANLANVKVTAIKGEDNVWVYRTQA
jgi:hypothetical protein